MALPSMSMEDQQPTLPQDLTPTPRLLSQSTTTVTAMESTVTTGGERLLFSQRSFSHAISAPIRIGSPSPARNQSRGRLPEKIDFDKVRERAQKKVQAKRDLTPVAHAVKTIKGFRTPIRGRTGQVTSGDESETSGASTPVLAPWGGRKHSQSTTAVYSVTSSPYTRPATPSQASGISTLKLKLESLSLGRAAFSPPLRSSSMQRVNTNGSVTSEAISENDSTENESYEVPLRSDFISLDATKPPPLSDLDLGAGVDSSASDSASSRCQSLAPSTPPQRKMTADEFEPITCLGKGTYGTVLLVRQRSTGRLFAQKQLKKASLIVRKKLVEQTRTERAILESVNRHPFVVKLFYAFQDAEKLYLILEYAQGGELFHHLSMERMFDEDTVAFYMAEMVLALEHLHRNLGVVYRDLKPENCLLDTEGHLLLTDFGLSKVAVDDADKCRSFMGTVEYMAPEIIQGHEYGAAVDWWSLGALGHDLLTGSPPFSGANNAKIQEKILKAKLKLPYYLGPDVKDLLTRLMRKDPKKRLGGNMPKDLDIIKKHRFFRKINWAKLAKRELDPPIKPIVTDPVLAENFATEFTSLRLSVAVNGKMKVDDESMLMDGPGIDDENPFGGFSFVASSSLLNESMDWDRE
jgi:serine/threonine-protein kinase Psk1